MIPPGALSDLDTRILLETVTQTRPTVRSIGSAIHRSPSVVYRHLLHLRHHGLVSWEYQKDGILHATCKIVADAEQLWADQLTREDLIRMWEEGEPVELTSAVEVLPDLHGQVGEAARNDSPQDADDDVIDHSSSA